MLGLTVYPDFEVSVDVTGRRMSDKGDKGDKGQNR